MTLVPTISAPMIRRLRESNWREVVLWLLVMAMVMRAIMPVGFMPTFGQGTKGFITICSGAGLLQIPAAEANGEQQQEPATVKASHDCVLCAAPVQSAGSDFDGQIIALFFAILALHGIVWFGLQRRRYNAAAPPRAPPHYS